jgi:hypothetical protein
MQLVQSLASLWGEMGIMGNKSGDIGDNASTMLGNASRCGDKYGDNASTMLANASRCGGKWG